MKYRTITSDELTRIELTIAGILKDKRLVDSFRPYGLDRDDVKQEARFSGWKWLARLDKATPLEDRYRMLRGRVLWDLRDLLRVLSGARRSPETRDVLQAITNAAPLDDVKTGKARFCEIFGEQARPLEDFKTFICDIIDEARTLDAGA